MITTKFCAKIGKIIPLSQASHSADSLVLLNTLLRFYPKCIYCKELLLVMVLKNVISLMFTDRHPLSQVFKENQVINSKKKKKKIGYTHRQHSRIHESTVQPQNQIFLP